MIRRDRGDTIVEVLFAVTIFSMVAVGGLALMNQGAAMAQRSLEIGLVREQMDSQAEALRYAHDAYIAQYDGNVTSNSPAAKVWLDIAKAHASPLPAQSLEAMSNGQKCQLPALSTGGSNGNPFAIDTKKLDGSSGDPSLDFGASAAGQFVPVSSFNVTTIGTDDPLDVTYAQIRDINGQAVSQGIWIQAVSNPTVSGVSGYYDFHIRACWLTPGQSAPVTLGTIVRLYDPTL